jgi:hypothetical protein
MNSERVATFSRSRPRCSLTGEGDLLAAEARLIADHGAGREHIGCPENTLAAEIEPLAT